MAGGGVQVWCKLQQVLESARERREFEADEEAARAPGSKQ